jgi:DNA invertase Pin-like site-specific DNA recombinase
MAWPVSRTGRVVLDRLTRGGVEDTLRLIRKLRERNVTLVSVQEPWLNGSAEVTDLLVAFAAWMAQQESARRSERIRAGLARRKAQGGHVGRKPGAHDSRPRRTAGYVGNRNASRAA